MHIKEAEQDDYFINNIAVHPGFRGHGVGRVLMALAEKQASAEGLDKCALTVDMQNEAAIRLYRQLGYAIVHSSRVKRLQRRIGFTGLYRMVKTL